MDGVTNVPCVLNAAESTLCPKENIYVMIWKFLEMRYLKVSHYLLDCETKGCIFIPTRRHNSPIIVRYVPIAFPYWSLSIVDEGHKHAISDVIVGQSPLGIFILPMTQLKEESEHST